VAVDPVGSGFVESLSRPGGNITGLSLQGPDLAGKRLELLREIVPGRRRLAIMVNVGYVAAKQELAQVQVAAAALGFDSVVLEIREAEDIAPAFDALNDRADALYVVTEAFGFFQRRSYQYLGLGRANSHDYWYPRGHPSGRPHLLWTESSGFVPARGRVCRQDSAWSEARRYPGRAAHEIRACRQSHDREGARAQRPAGPACTR
jgi:hypothetical protein